MTKDAADMVCSNLQLVSWQKASDSTVTLLRGKVAKLAPASSSGVYVSPLLNHSMEVCDQSKCTLRVWNSAVDDIFQVPRCN